MGRIQQHQARCKVCGKYGHKEAKCELLAMFLWCRKYMMDMPEDEVNSVFKYWYERNKKHPS